MDMSVWKFLLYPVTLQPGITVSFGSQSEKINIYKIRNVMRLKDYHLLQFIEKNAWFEIFVETLSRSPTGYKQVHNQP